MRGKGNIMAMNRANDNLFAEHVEFEVSVICVGDQLFVDPVRASR